VRIVQLTDTHVVAPGARCHGLDTGAYLAAAIAAVNALPEIDFTLVTGDLTDHGGAAEYAHFATRMAALRTPYAVVPGNHDDRDRLRAALPAHVYGAASGPRVTYALALGGLQLLVIDANLPGASPGARIDAATFAWLEARLTAEATPALLAVHQPPFPSGMPYLDVFGFGGAKRLRALLDRHPRVGRVVSGHIHCVKRERWRHALACTAPSTAPQWVPLLRGRDVLLQEPGFAVHGYANGGWTTTVYRRGAGPAFEPAEVLE